MSLVFVSGLVRFNISSIQSFFLSVASSPTTLSSPLAFTFLKPLVCSIRISLPVFKGMSLSLQHHSVLVFRPPNHHCQFSTIVFISSCCCPLTSSGLQCCTYEIMRKAVLCFAILRQIGQSLLPQTCCTPTLKLKPSVLF